jgi:hypothetical protein
MSRTLELLLGIASIVMAVGMLAAIPWVVRRLPQDYFVRPTGSRSLPVRVFRNSVAVLLVSLGAALLVLPGQGIVTILLGLSILDLPIKHRALAWLFRRPKIQHGIQRLRAKVGRPPLLIPVG